MSTYLLIPGAGGAAWYWHRVSPLLQAAGHSVIAVDLPGANEEIGLPGYADLIALAGAGETPARAGRAVDGRVLGTAGVPAAARTRARPPQPHDPRAPGGDRQRMGGEHRRGGSEDRGGAHRRLPGEVVPTSRTYFLHDVPPAVAADGLPHQRPEADIAFEQPCPFERWPDVLTTVLAGRDDRLFPLDFQRRVARERIACAVQALPGRHLNALSEPQAVTAALVASA